MCRLWSTDGTFSVTLWDLISSSAGLSASSCYSNRLVSCFRMRTVKKEMFPCQREARTFPFWDGNKWVVSKGVEQAVCDYCLLFSGYVCLLFDASVLSFCAVQGFKHTHCNLKSFLVQWSDSRWGVFLASAGWCSTSAALHCFSLIQTWTRGSRSRDMSSKLPTFILQQEWVHAQ